MKNISYEKFNSKNIEHLKLYKEIEQTEKNANYFDDWKIILEDSENPVYENDILAFAVKNEDLFLGFSTVSLYDNKAVLSLKLLPKYYNKYSFDVRESMLGYLSENNINEVYAYFNNKDENAKRVLLEQGYNESDFSPIEGTDISQITLFNNKKNIK